MRTSIALLVLACASAPLAARADSPPFGFVGLSFTRSSNKIEGDNKKWEFTHSYVAMDGYILAAPIYVRISHAFWGGLSFKNETTTTDKITGVVSTDKQSGYINDQFIAVLPKLEFGAAFGDGPLKPTVGLYFADSVAYVPDEARVFYAIDLGIAAGVAFTVGGDAFAVVVHPTLRLNASFYNQQRHFGDGGGGAGEVLLGVKFTRILAAFIRFGAEGHTLHGNHWMDSGGAPEGIMRQGNSYFRIGIGYSPG